MDSRNFRNKRNGSSWNRDIYIYAVYKYCANRNETGFYISYGGIWARIKDVETLMLSTPKLQDAVFYFTYKGIPETETDLLEKQLKAYRALHTNYPTTNVSTDSTPQAGLEMEYVADTKSYIDKNSRNCKSPGKHKHTNNKQSYGGYRTCMK